MTKVHYAIMDPHGWIYNRKLGGFDPGITVHNENAIFESLEEAEKVQKECEAKHHECLVSKVSTGRCKNGCK